MSARNRSRSASTDNVIEWLGVDDIRRPRAVCKQHWAITGSFMITVHSAHHVIGSSTRARPVVST